MAQSRSVQFFRCSIRLTATNDSQYCEEGIQNGHIYETKIQIAENGERKCENSNDDHND